MELEKCIQSFSQVNENVLTSFVFFFSFFVSQLIKSVWVLEDSLDKIYLRCAIDICKIMMDDSDIWLTKSSSGNSKTIDKSIMVESNYLNLLKCFYCTFYSTTFIWQIKVLDILQI